MIKLTPEAEFLLRAAWQETPNTKVRCSINDLLKFCNLSIEEDRFGQLHRLKQNLAAIRKLLFIPYANQEKTIQAITDRFNALHKAKVTLNDWRLWYDSISKEDIDKGPIYGATLQSLEQIEKLPGLSGGIFEKVELPPKQAELNKEVGEDILETPLKCQHDFTGPAGVAIDGGSCLKCGRTVSEILAGEQMQWRSNQ